MSPGLFQGFMSGYIKPWWVYKTLPISGRTQCSGYDCGLLIKTESQIESYGQPIFDSVFVKCLFRISGTEWGGHKILRPS